MSDVCFRMRLGSSVKERTAAEGTGYFLHIIKDTYCHGDLCVPTAASVTCLKHCLSDMSVAKLLFLFPYCTQ